MSSAQAPTQLYLASTSPRRRELLRQLGLSFELVDIDCEEQPMAGEKPEAYVARVAMDKAQAGWQAVQERRALPVLAADTEVVIGETVLGKPQGLNHAVDMLLSLSGRTHRVMTAVAIIDEQRSRLIVQTSRVTMREISRRECQAYWRTGEPEGKAGGYAVQGLGALFISELQGSYSGVMGLPLYETSELLAQFGVNVLAAGSH